METNQKLGIKVFYYYLSKKISVGLILIIFSFIIASLKKSIISKVVLVFPQSTSSNIVGYFIAILFIISILFIVGGVIASLIDYLSNSFNLGENAISIKRGFISKKEISIPYRQIQDINIEQSLNFKMMGISKMILLTAGDDDNDKEGESEGIFKVIDMGIAEKIKEYILQKTNI